MPLVTELKRTDVISGWNPSLVGPGRAELRGTELGRQRDWRGDERAIFPVERHVPTGGKNSRKSSIRRRPQYGYLAVPSVLDKA